MSKYFKYSDNFMLVVFLENPSAPEELTTFGFRLTPVSSLQAKRGTHYLSGEFDNLNFVFIRHFLMSPLIPRLRDGRCQVLNYPKMIG